MEFSDYCCYKHYCYKAFVCEFFGARVRIEALETEKGKFLVFKKLP